MDPEMRIMVRDLLELTKENNAMLHKMHRGLFWGRVFSLFYWLIVAGGFVASYYYLEPYINSAISTYEKVSTGAQKSNTMMQDFEKMYKAMQTSGTTK